MQWQFIVALVLVVAIVLVPVAFIWYLNVGGMMAWVRRAVGARKAEKGVAERAVK
jgi:hypothetical protein